MTPGISSHGGRTARLLHVSIAPVAEWSGATRTRLALEWRSFAQPGWLKVRRGEVDTRNLMVWMLRRGSGASV